MRKITKVRKQFAVGLKELAYAPELRSLVRIDRSAATGAAKRFIAHKVTPEDADFLISVVAVLPHLIALADMSEELVDRVKKDPGLKKELAATLARYAEVRKAIS